MRTSRRLGFASLTSPFSPSSEGGDCVEEGMGEFNTFSEMWGWGSAVGVGVGGGWGVWGRTMSKALAISCVAGSKSWVCCMESPSGMRGTPDLVIGRCAAAVRSVDAGGEACTTVGGTLAGCWPLSDISASDSSSNPRRGQYKEGGFPRTRREDRRACEGAGWD